MWKVLTLGLLLSACGDGVPACERQESPNPKAMMLLCGRGGTLCTVDGRYAYSCGGVKAAPCVFSAVDGERFCVDNVGLVGEPNACATYCN